MAKLKEILERLYGYNIEKALEEIQALWEEKCRKCLEEFHKPKQ